MRRNFLVLAIMTVTAAASATFAPLSASAAQNPPQGQGMPPMPPMGGRGGNQGATAGAAIGERSAQMLMARSAQLELTDAQVVKLAGIARRAEARHKTMRTAMDSARAKFTQPGDSLARRQFGQKMQADMTKERDLARIDLRDAIATLTPDQQATAWEMNAARGSRGAGRGASGGRRGPGGQMGPGGGMPGAQGGARPRRPARPPEEVPGERIPA